MIIILGSCMREFGYINMWNWMTCCSPYNICMVNWWYKSKMLKEKKGRWKKNKTCIWLSFLLFHNLQEKKNDFWALGLKSDSASLFLSCWVCWLVQHQYHQIPSLHLENEIKYFTISYKSKIVCFKRDFQGFLKFSLLHILQ
jgi:hypothetical protein